MNIIVSYMSDIDIHHGLSADNLENKTIIFSVGHRCTSASLIKELRLKFESYPFDWVVSKLDTIVHCIETNFQEYLHTENYQNKQSETFNLCDGHKRHVGNENIVYNTYYESHRHTNESPNNIGTYGMKLALTHHDMRIDKNRAYFERCIERFNNILESSRQKFYLYVTPIMGLKDYKQNVGQLLHNCVAFTEYMKTQTLNSFGIYFIAVKNEEKKGEVEILFETNDNIIIIIYTNNNLIDGGGVYDGDFYTEQYKMLVTIENVIKKQQEHFTLVSH